MNKSCTETLFWTGTFFLYIAMLVLTVVPVLISEYLPFIYINLNGYRNTAAVLFVIAFIFYFISKNTFKKQLSAIFIAFCYFYIYTNFFID